MSTEFRPAHCLAQHPSVPSVIHAGGKHGPTNGMAVQRSHDGGSTLAPATVLEPATTACLDIAAAPADSRVLYAVGGWFYQPAKAYRSNDGGETWQDVTNDLPGERATAVCVDPRAWQGVFVATSEGVFHSADGGAHWVPTGLPKQARALVYDPYGRALYAATAGDGVYVLSEGAAWRPMNTDLVSQDCLCAAIDPENRYLFVGTSGGGAWRARIGPMPARPGPVDVDGAPSVNGEPNCAGPAARSLRIRGIDAGGNPTGALLAIRIEGLGWLRRDGEDLRADAPLPTWLLTDDWTGRLRGLAPNTMCDFRALAKLGAEESPEAQVGGHATTLTGDCNASGLPTALDGALMRAAILRGRTAGAAIYWPGDLDDDRDVDADDLRQAIGAILHPTSAPPPRP